MKKDPKEIWKETKATLDRVRDSIKKEDSLFPVRIYSKTLDENFILYKDDKIVFEESGVVYNKEEWRRFRGLRAKDLTAIHNIKRTFNKEGFAEIMHHREGKQWLN